jgi:hypothetical protein
MRRIFCGVDITPRSVYRTEIELLKEELNYTKKRLEDSELGRLNANKALHHFSATLENIVEMFGDRLNKIDKRLSRKLCHYTSPKKNE